METETKGIEPTNIEEKEDPSKKKEVLTWRTALISLFTKVVEFDSKKATEGYLNDPWAGPIGH